MIGWPSRKARESSASQLNLAATHALTPHPAPGDQQQAQAKPPRTPPPSSVCQTAAMRGLR
jgi:hypothetical protein